MGMEHSTIAEPRAAAKAGMDARRKWGIIVVADSVVTLFFLGVLCFAGYYKFAGPPMPEVKEPKAPKGSKFATPGAKPGPAVPEPGQEPKGGEPPEHAKAEPAKAEPAKAEAPKTAEAPKKEPPKDEKALPKDKPVGSPGVHAASLPRRGAEPLPAHAAAKTEKGPPATAPSGAKPRAVATEFTHKAASAKDVYLKGAFLVRTRGRLSMIKDSQGVWHVSVSLLPGSYKYAFVVDGKATDPLTQNVD